MNAQATIPIYRELDALEARVQLAYDKRTPGIDATSESATINKHVVAFGIDRGRRGWKVDGKTVSFINMLHKVFDRV